MSKNTKRPPNMQKRKPVPSLEPEFQVQIPQPYMQWIGFLQQFRTAVQDGWHPDLTVGSPDFLRVATAIKPYMDSPDIQEMMDNMGMELIWLDDRIPVLRWSKFNQYIVVFDRISEIEGHEMLAFSTYQLLDSEGDSKLIGYNHVMIEEAAQYVQRLAPVGFHFEDDAHQGKMLDALEWLKTESHRAQCRYITLMANSEAMNELQKT